MGQNCIEVRGARVHNLKNVDVDVPLGEIVGVAGVSGSGKSSLALGVLYAEGSRRYLEALSTYTRRRMSYAGKALVDDIRHVPAALALHQRPGIPGIRSTFGTASELLNSLRLMFSRLSSHRCPEGHYVPPSLNVAAEKPLTCPVCGAVFYAPSAEELSFNSQGACRTCAGTGVVRTVDRATLIPDDTLTIDGGAVAPWNTLMWSLMTDVCRAMGVRTDVPFKELSAKEKEIVYDGPQIKKHILYRPKNGEGATELDFTYYSATATVLNALSKVRDDKGMKRVERFLREDPCPDCQGTRLSAAARAPLLNGRHLDEVCALTLKEALAFVRAVPASLPPEFRPMAEVIAESFEVAAQRLISLGLDYLTLDRATATLSTGERQRLQLARAVRNRTTGVLYVLDEPSIGLHPANIEGLNAVMHDLIRDGNSVILVDHDPQILSEAGYLIEMGPGSGKEGGEVLCQGPMETVLNDPRSRIALFLRDKVQARVRPAVKRELLFEKGKLTLKTAALHTVKPLEVSFPRGRLSVVTGVSGSGKTTLVLESLVPALKAHSEGRPLPSHVLCLESAGLSEVRLIDATPIGINIRSTLATYSGVHDELRKLMARTQEAKERGLKAGDFSYNTGKLRCPTCDGTGIVSLDVQFLPDVDIPCPDCHGARYSREVEGLSYVNKDGVSRNLKEIMDMEVREALLFFKDVKSIREKLAILNELGLGYLTLGEDTPGLSGGEAQRLKLASDMGRSRENTLFVFDEPTIGLHPLDVRTLLKVFDALVSAGATVVVIEHDVSVMRNADYLIDMGPYGGDRGGSVVAAGAVEEVKKVRESVTARYL